MEPDESHGAFAADALPAAVDARGVDRSLVRWMLSLSPVERLAQLQGSIELVASVRGRRRGAR